MEPQELVYSSKRARAVLLVPQAVVGLGVGVMVGVRVFV